ncbi:MAG: SPFH domain-containing protein [Steroidobacteraceae bacterium]
MAFGNGGDVARGVLRKIFGRGAFIVGLIFVVLLLGGVFGTIDTGNVGVRTTLGTMSRAEVTPGVYLKWPLISRVNEFTAKEIAIDLTDLTPKARDNLSLRDMDISVYYRAEPGAIADLYAKYSGQSERQEGTDYLLPAYNLVYRVARNAAYEEVAKVDSLVMHTQRDALSTAMHENMQAELEMADPGVFKVTRVVIRAVSTDPSIEESIQNAVANQKKLEAMEVQTKIAEKEAQIKVTEARGISESNRIISGSLTREYLQHEANQALLRFAESGNTSTVIVPAGMSVAPLINVNQGNQAPRGGAATPPR